MDHLVALTDAFHTGVLARHDTCAVELVREDRIENLVDQRGFSRSRNARHTGEHSQRKVHRQILEIVFTGTHHVQLLGLAHLAT